MTDSHILSLREQDALHNEWLAYRLEQILPKLMRRTHIDLWIVLSREYNEDPVTFTLLPATSLNASRLTGFVYALNDEDQVDCYSISSKTAKRYAPFYKAVWAKGDETQFECLTRLIAEKDPQRIGIDVSETFALADGLSKTLYDQLVAALHEPYRQRLVSAEELAVGWLETRSPAELAVYPELNHIAHGRLRLPFVELDRDIPPPKHDHFSSCTGTWSSRHRHTFFRCHGAPSRAGKRQVFHLIKYML